MKPTPGEMLGWREIVEKVEWPANPPLTYNIKTPRRRHIIFVIDRYIKYLEARSEVLRQIEEAENEPA